MFYFQQKFLMHIFYNIKLSLPSNIVNTLVATNALKMKFSIRSFLRIWSHLLKKSSMENFIFCAVHREFSGLEMISWFPGNESITEQ